MDWMEDHFRHIDREHENLDAEFRRLCAELSSKVPTVGDRVVVAAGLLGMGHPWVRHEGVVEECGDTSYRVLFTDYASLRNEPYRRWVHQALITDVLSRKANSETAA